MIDLAFFVSLIFFYGKIRTLQRTQKRDVVYDDAEGLMEQGDRKILKIEYGASSLNLHSGGCCFRTVSLVDKSGRRDMHLFSFVSSPCFLPLQNLFFEEVCYDIDMSKIRN